MLSILDPNFKYVNSIETDIRKTFARIMREQSEVIEIKPIQDLEVDSERESE